MSEVNESEQQLVPAVGVEQHYGTEIGVVNGQGNAEGSSEIRGDVQGAKETKENTNSQTQDEVDEAKLEDYVQSAISSGVLSLNAITLRRVYPKAIEVLKNHMSNKSFAPVEDEAIIGGLLYAPTVVLYHFFDSNDIFINVIGSKDRWEHVITYESSNFNFPSRVEAEIDAFHKAFETLNNKLS